MAAPYTYVALPIPNVLLAEAFIRDNALTINSEYRVFVSLDRPVTKDCLAKLTTHFMEQHPRGKGTTGNDLLREFYAACYAITRNNSRNWRQRQVERTKSDVTLTAPQIKIVLALREAGGWAMQKDIGRWNRSYDALAKFGIIEGYVGDRIWLTDRGLPTAQSYAARVLRAETEAKRKSDDDIRSRLIDYHTNLVAIAGEDRQLHIDALELLTQ